MEVSELIPVPSLCNDNTNPQIGLQSSSSCSSSTTKSAPDPSPSDLGHTAELVEEFQNLDLGDAEEKSSNKEEEEEEGSNSDDINKNISEVEDGNDNENENGDQLRKKYPYPVRPDAEDCAYYMKTGSCKFGSNCKFNHPARRKNQGAKEKVKEREELVEKPGQSQIECKYYLKTGGCKFGMACRFSHTRVKSPVVPILELNFMGLPIRPGEKECPFYMRNGSCKYGSNCRFNHPDPTAVGGSDSPSGYGNGGSISSQAASQTSLGSWSSPRALNETASFVQMIYTPSQAAASQKAEWNGYQGPVIPPERSLNPTPAYAMKPPVIETNLYTHQRQQQQQQMLVDEFPERPGQPECSYFLKTGDCKFKSNCKYHHPKNRTSKSQPCALSDKGLPLRPDQNICSHYNRYGICKFGPACKFDHPVQLAVSSTESGLDSHPHFSNSATVEETGGAANGTDN